MRYFLLISIWFIWSSINAQSPTHFTDSTGTLYWRKSTPVYLFVSDSPDGDAERITSKRSAKYTDPFYLDTEGVNYIRSRNAVDPVTKRVIPDTEVMFEIYADGMAPRSSIKYLGASPVKRDRVYYKSGLSVELSAEDQLSGLSKLTYQVNDEPEQPYTKGIVFNDKGFYKLTFYSEDKVGNVEEKQTVEFGIDPEPPYSDLSVNGITEESVISLSSKLYIQAYDSISGVKTVYFKFDDTPYQRYNGTSISVRNLEEGDHKIAYYAEDYVGNKESERVFDFYLDRSAPLMVADVLGDRFIVGDEIYFSGRTKLKLTAVDNKVGVKEIMYAIDSEDFTAYESPFYLPSISGVHIIRYYSVDNLNNSTADSKKSRYLGEGGFEEFKHNVNKFYVDLTGPVIKHEVLDYSFVRGDTLFIGPYSKIRFSGKDPESGLKQFTYALAESVGEEAYEGPFTLTGQKQGFYQMDYFGYDNVNNRNIGEMNFFLDNTSPVIFIQFNTGSIEHRNGKISYPSNSGIFLSATDKTSGITSLEYSLDDGIFLPYAGLISNFKKGKHSITVRARDFLNNQQEETLEFHIK